MTPTDNTDAKPQGEGGLMHRTNVQKAMRPVLAYLINKDIPQRVAEEAAERATDEAFRLLSASADQSGVIGALDPDLLDYVAGVLDEADKPVSAASLRTLAKDQRQALAAHAASIGGGE